MVVGYHPIPKQDPDKTENARNGSRGAVISKLANSSGPAPIPPQKSIRFCALIALLSSFGTLYIIAYGYGAANIRPKYEETYIDKPETDMKNILKMPQTDETNILIRSLVKNTRIHNSTCTYPVNKVGFSKTHKTASSTIQNIIFRYALEKEWNLVMYDSGSQLGPPAHQYDLSTPFEGSWLKKVPWREMVQEQGYNAFALHSMWNKEEVELVLGPGAVYFTILRSPVEEFESLYNYVHFEKTFKMDIERFTLKFVKGNFPVRRVNHYLGRNQQFWDLGRYSGEIKTVEDVQQKIMEIEREFDLVMVSEDMEASLVLLAEELCWPLSSFTSLPLNTRKKTAIDMLSTETRKLLKEWLWADEMLYSYFKQLLEKKKTLFGLENMKNKVEELKEMNDEIRTVCLEKISTNTSELSADFKPWSDDVIGFKINETVPWCRYYGMAELKFIDLLRENQRTRLRKWSHASN